MALAEMSVEDLQAEVERQTAIANAAMERVRRCQKAIAEKMAKFHVGDLVVRDVLVGPDRNTVFEVTEQRYDHYADDKTRYYGRRVKGDGYLGGVVQELHTPLRLAKA